MKLGDYELNQIITGDARELMRGVPDKSVDLIFTDPVYDRIEDYQWLAQEASRVLKPDGHMLVWSNGKWHYKNTRWLDSHDHHYMWTFAVINNNQSTPMDGKIICKANRVIWFSRDGKRNMRDYYPDGVISIGGQYLTARIDGFKYRWHKPDMVTFKMLNAFGSENGIVLDPFTGGGTAPAVCKLLNRNYLGFEIDPDTAELARQRVRDTQPPLFVVEPEQLELDLGNVK